MNEIVSKFLLAGDKFMPEMKWGKLDLHMVLADHLQTGKKKNKNLKNQDMHEYLSKRTR